jgi:iron complex outermembrane receptor protein
MTLQDQTMFYIDPFINYYSNRGFKHSLRTRYFYTNNLSTDNTRLITKLSTETNVAYSEYQLTKEINEGLNITGGIIMNQTYSNSGLAYKGVLPNNHLQNFAGYTQVDKNMWKVLNISLGFREEAFIMNDTKVVTKPIFRSGLNLKLAEATFLRSSYGQGYRFPTITEKYIYSNLAGLTIYPNPQLEPETSWNMEIGMKQGFKINKFTGYVDFALFWQEYTNTIEFTFGVWDKNKDIFGDDSLSTGFKYLNTGPTRVKGFEISLPGEGKISKNLKVNILGGYTFVMPQALEPNEVFAVDSTKFPMSYASSSTDTTNYILKYRFQHIAKIDLQLTYKAFFIGGDFRYYSFVQNIDKIFYLFEPVLHSGIEKYRNENDNGTIVVDARIGMDITKKFKVSFIVNNAFNKNYSLRPLKIESPRTFAIRLSLNFGE